MVAKKNAPGVNFSVSFFPIAFAGEAGKLPVQISKQERRKQ